MQAARKAQGVAYDPGLAVVFPDECNPLSLWAPSGMYSEFASLANSALIWRTGALAVILKRWFLRIMLEVPPINEQCYL